MSIFKSNSFDSFIGQGVRIGKGFIHVPEGETVVLNGVIGGMDCMTTPQLLEVDKANKKVDLKTTVKFGGDATIDWVRIANVVVNGKLKVKRLHVEGTLSVSGDAKLEAEVILYRNLNIQQGAVIQAELKHLDHCSEGEEGIVG